MKESESLQQFYERKYGKLPNDINNGESHFNIMRLPPYIEGKNTSIPYRRRDFYKIMLIKGESKVHYTDRTKDIKKQALSFSNPLIPYKWEHLDKVREGIYCIFNAQFFNGFGNVHQYEVFQPQGEHIFELSDVQTIDVNQLFDRIWQEYNSGYRYRYDMVRALVLELLHLALKMTPAIIESERNLNATERISMLFIDLLERQFPIDDYHRTIGLRSASDFAFQLNVHVNHLNRSLKDTTGKTTTQLISNRLFSEAKRLLKHTDWNISEIAFALGFTEVTHFNNFFKKYAAKSPSKFRKS